MKNPEAKLLMTTGAIQRGTLFQDRNTGEWEIWLYGDEDDPLHPSIRNPIELARGGRRKWASLDTAHQWIKDLAGERRLAITIDS